MPYFSYVKKKKNELFLKITLTCKDNKKPTRPVKDHRFVIFALYVMLNSILKNLKNGSGISQFYFSSFLWFTNE